ncbi:hypothetical protein [Halovulum sp. GXIMD14793]
MQQKPVQPLNVGDVLGQTFATTFNRFPVLFAITVLPGLGLAAANAELQQRFLMLAKQLSSSALVEFALQALFLGVLSAAATVAAAGFVVLCAAELMFGKRLQPLDHFLHLLRALPVLLGTITASLIVACLPFAALAGIYYVMPGLLRLIWLPPTLTFLIALAGALYLMARMWVALPSVLIGGDGFNSISRSTWLTKGYRWPIFGAILLLLVLDLIIVFVASVGLGLLMQSVFGLSIDFNAAFSPEVLGLNTAVYSLILILMSVFTVQLYSRLREVKEGLGLGDVAAVFE